MITRIHSSTQALWQHNPNYGHSRGTAIRGTAAAIINKSVAEAKSVREIANAVVQAGENPTDYLLAVKYIDILKDIMQMRNTRINLLPKKTAFLITSQALGMNTLLPKGGARAN